MALDENMEFVNMVRLSVCRQTVRTHAVADNDLELYRGLARNVDQFQEMVLYCPGEW